MIAIYGWATHDFGRYHHKLQIRQQLYDHNAKKKQKIIASKTMKEVEEILEDHAFLRVHHSYIVNLNEVNKYIRGEGGYLLMSDGSKIDVSRSRREMLLKKLQPKRV